MNGSGLYITEKGYKRIALRSSSYYRWYEHRAVIDALTREWSFYGEGIPEGFSIHHMDFDKGNNEPENLLMIQNCLHTDLHKYKAWRNQRNGTSTYREDRSSVI